MKKIYIILCFFILGFSECSAKVRVLDGDSLILDNEEIRLIGIDAPEYKQYCFDPEGEKYECGEEAKKFLQELVAGRKIVCNKITKDIYDRNLSECFADEFNINIELLKSGWAVLYRGNDKEYVEAQMAAKENKRGLWQGKFMKPEFFRRLQKKKDKRLKKS